MAKLASGERLATEFRHATNPYLQTLLNPANVHGVRVPDGAQDSATCTEICRTSITASSNGIAAAMFGASQTANATNTVAVFASLVPTASFNGAYAWDLGVVNHTDASSTQIFGTSYVKVLHPAMSVLAANNRLVRVVSAGVHAYSTAALATNQGTIWAAPLCEGVAGEKIWTDNFAFTMANVKLFPGLICIPAREAAGLNVRWRPGGPTTRTFCEMEACTALEPETPGFRYHDIGGFLIVGEGLESGAVINIEVVINLEMVPLTNAYMPTGTMAIDDPLALADASNEVADSDQARKGEGGFDGLKNGGHELLKAPGLTAVVSKPADGKKTKGPEPAEVIGHLAPFSKPTVTLGSSRSGGRLKKLQGRYEESEGQGDTFGEILKMILPVVAKVAPTLLSLI